MTMGDRYSAAYLLILLLYTSLRCVNLRRLRSGILRICFLFRVLTLKHSSKILFPSVNVDGRNISNCTKMFLNNINLLRLSAVGKIMTCRRISVCKISYTRLPTEHCCFAKVIIEKNTGTGCPRQTWLRLQAFSPLVLHRQYSIHNS